jgi:anaerobic C4-dicarboxylate transporter
MYRGNVMIWIELVIMLLALCLGARIGGLGTDR